MEQRNKGKLNWLQRNLPEGLVVDAAWLKRQGFSSALRSKYATRGWLEQVTRGVYRRPPHCFSPVNKIRGRDGKTSLFRFRPYWSARLSSVGGLHWRCKDSRIT